MRSTRVLSIIMFAIGITLLQIRVENAHAQDSLEIEAGRPFPNLVFPSLEDGSAMSIADFRGRKVLLHVFASW